MKLRIPILLLFMFLCASFYGIDQRLSLGLTAGINANGGSAEDIDILYDSQGQKVPGALSSTLVGGQIGLFMQYQLPDYFFGLQGELMFLFNRGLSYYDVAHGNFRAKIYGHQAALNLLFQGIITTTDIISFAISVGPSFTFPVSSFNQDIAYQKTGTHDCRGFTSLPFSYGIVAGIGLQIQLGPGFFLIDGRFTMDFTPFVAERNISLNTPLAVQVGYSFYLLGEKR